MTYKTHTLNNGIRLIHQDVDSDVAYCGLIINTGSRDEETNEHGLAHFIEHLLFKGTKKRKAYHILNRLESVGGEINAYTTKEETCIYTAFLWHDYERSLELISDITFNSDFPEKEIEKEKLVILDEINSYKDNPSELIFDDYEEYVFKDSAIGRNILGNKKLLLKFNKPAIQKFINNNYHTDQMVISSVGKIDFKKLERLVEKHFSHIKPNIRCTKRVLNNNYVPFLKVFKKKTFQTHCIIGNVAYPANSEKRIGLVLLNNILGGPGFNSKLNYALREKNAYAYNIESQYHPYSDTGIFTIYFGTDKENINKSVSLIHKEIDVLMKKKLTDKQLTNAKRQILGQLAIYSDNNENLMLSNGKSYLVFNKVDNLKEIEEKVNNISSLELQQIAIEVLNKDNLSTLIFQ